MACSICRMETRHPQGYHMKVEVLSTTKKETHCINFFPPQLYGFIYLLVLVWFHYVVCLYGTCVLDRRHFGILAA